MNCLPVEGFHFNVPEEILLFNYYKGSKIFINISVVLILTRMTNKQLHIPAKVSDTLELA